MTTPWQKRYAQRMNNLGSSAIRELLKLTQRPEIISFAGGLPAAELFPIFRFQEATERVLRQQGQHALQYSTTEGYLPLRELIVEKMWRYGIKATADNVLITSGSQQALDLIGKLLLNPGDLVLTERPTYLGALQAWNAYQAEYTTIPIDGEGLQTELLPEALCAGPKFMYILPNFQNPGGVTLPYQRRLDLVHTADQYGIPIIEDDPYGELRYEGAHLPPLVVLDAQELGEGEEGFLRGNVIYLSTFSKTLAPGLRLGWMVAPESVIQACVRIKQGMDLHSSIFTQMVVYEVAKNGFLKEHVRYLRDVYRERRDVMLASMAEHFPAEAQWTRPQGGLFLWVTLPDGVDTAELLNQAVKQNVAFVPGHSFHPNGRGHNSLRLNFSSCTPEQIVIGIARLGKVLPEVVAKCQPLPV